MRDAGAPPFEDRFCVSGLYPDQADYMIDTIIEMLFNLPKDGELKILLVGHVQLYGKETSITLTVLRESDELGVTERDKPAGEDS